MKNQDNSILTDLRGLFASLEGFLRHFIIAIQMYMPVEHRCMCCCCCADPADC